MKYTLLVVTLLSMISCKSAKEDTSKLDAVNESNITFLDSTMAVEQILTDRHDGFFNSLSVVEMAIQMQTTKRYDSRETALADYKAMLATQVYDWKQVEKDTLARTFQKAQNLIEELNPNLWPRRIELIKIKTDHYGPDVYYTREDAILIPDNVFADKRSSDALLPVMLHEIFHLLSRYDDEFRTKMYATIDFVPHGRSVNLSSALESKRLSNPDGMTLDYAIKLEDGEGNSELAIPFLISNQPYYSDKLPSFFAYLKFDLYALKLLNDGSAMLVSDVSGNTVLSPAMQNNYFDHIKDNTQYVIHPEEVMADNFMLAIQSHHSKDYTEYSVDGKKLIDTVTDELSQYKK